MDAHRIWKALDYSMFDQFKLRTLNTISMFSTHRQALMWIPREVRQLIFQKFHWSFSFVSFLSIHLFSSIHLPSSFPPTFCTFPLTFSLWCYITNTYMYNAVILVAKEQQYTLQHYLLINCSTNVHACSGTHNKILIVDYFPYNTIYFVVILLRKMYKVSLCTTKQLANSI